MRHIDKGAEPAELVAHGTTWTREYEDWRTGTPPRRAEPKRWQRRAIKDALRSEADDLCIYCESKVSATYFGDAEHLLPRTSRPDLVVTWTNLGWVCADCNSRKRDYYSTTEPLTNPFVDDPVDDFQFLGPLLFARPGRDRGIRTRAVLDLDRGPLVERRLATINGLRGSVDAWARMTPGVTRDVVRQEIVDRAERGEHRAFARAFLAAYVGW